MALHKFNGRGGLPVLSALLMLLASLAPAANAASIISNYPVSGETGCCTLLGLVTRSWGAGFTMPAGATYTLDSVTMRLQVNATGGTFTLQLYGGTAANPSGPALATLQCRRSPA